MNKESLEFLINRFDKYFDSVNNKSNFFLAFNSFLLGGVITCYKDVSEHFKCPYNLHYFNCVLIVFMLLTLLSITLILMSLFPYLSSKSESKQDYKSMLFFGSIGSMKQSEFVQKSEIITRTELESDMRIQVHELAKGLKLKYQLMKKVGWLTVSQIIIVLILILIFSKS